MSIAELIMEKLFDYGRFPSFGAPSTKIRYEALPSMDPYPKKKEVTLIKNYFFKPSNHFKFIQGKL